MKKLLFLLIFPVFCFGQNKKALIATVNRLKSDSINLQFKVTNKVEKINNLKASVNILNESLNLEKAKLNNQKLKNLEIQKSNNKYEKLIKELVSEKEYILDSIKNRVFFIEDQFQKYIKDFYGWGGVATYDFQYISGSIKKIYNEEKEVKLEEGYSASFSEFDCVITDIVYFGHDTFAITFGRGSETNDITKSEIRTPFFINKNTEILALAGGPAYDPDFKIKSLINNIENNKWRPWHVETKNGLIIKMEEIY